MGQKLVTINFSAGSSSDLWNPNLKPNFQVQVKADGGTWTTVTKYYPDLTKMSGLPANLGNPQTLTNTLLQGLIRNNQTAAFLVDDSTVQWQIQFSENFLTEGAWKVLAGGYFN